MAASQKRPPFLWGSLSRARIQMGKTMGTRLSGRRSDRVPRPWARGEWSRRKKQIVSRACSCSSLNDYYIDTPPADAFNPDDIFYERTDAREVRNTAQDDSGMSDSDSESPQHGWPQQQPVHYVYDAVAERTQQLLEQMSLVNGVH